MPVPLAPPTDPVSAPRHPGAGRWLAAAAAFVIVAALAAWVLAGRSPSIPALPAAPPGPTVSNPLLGTAWIATSLYGRPARTAPKEAPFLEFRADSTFGGGDPCNGVGGTYRLDGVRLRLTRGPATEIGCDVDQQQRFTRALDECRQLNRDGELLQLLDSSGAVVATFRPGAATGPSPRGTATGTPADRPADGPVATSVPQPSDAGPTAAVRVRIRNASTVDFEAVRAVFPDGTQADYGAVASGQRSGYVLAGPPVYGYAFVEVTAAGEVHRFQPRDYVGEGELEPGHYTYVLALADGSLDLRLEADD